MVFFDVFYLISVLLFLNGIQLALFGNNEEVSDKKVIWTLANFILGAGLLLISIGMAIGINL